MLDTQRPDSSGRAPSTQPLALRGGPSCEEAQPARPGVFRRAWRSGRAGAEALKQQRFKEAVELFKPMIRQDPRPEWKHSLAEASPN
jgi:hypothetical protein